MGSDIYFVNGNQINKITRTGDVAVVAGAKEEGGYVDGPSAAARFKLITGLATAYFAQYAVLAIDNFSLIRAISLDGGTVLTLTNGKEGFKDGPLSEAEFSGIVGLTVAYDGTIYVLDQNGNYIRKISNGYVTTLSVPNFSLQFQTITSTYNWIFVSSGNRIFQLY